MLTIALRAFYFCQRAWVMFCLASVGLVACSSKSHFEQAEILGGRSVPASVLEQGLRVYSHYCATCHGAEGDGKGVTAVGQWPPPRDFRTATFKFAGVVGRGLPTDEQLTRIITHGLAGTYMRAWTLPSDEIEAVVQYIKTFSAKGTGFRDASRKLSPFTVSPDPFRTSEELLRAVAEGKELYHGRFQCSACHPVYASDPEMQRWGMSARFPHPEASVVRWSENYQSMLVPTDFKRNQMRAVRTRKGPTGQIEVNPGDIYRAIAHGLQGPMPGFGNLGTKQVWAVTHYVKSLADGKNLVPTPRPPPREAKAR